MFTKLFLLLILIGGIGCSSNDSHPVSQEIVTNFLNEWIFDGPPQNFSASWRGYCDFEDYDGTYSGYTYIDVDQDLNNLYSLSINFVAPNRTIELMNLREPIKIDYNEIWYNNNYVGSIGEDGFSVGLVDGINYLAFTLFTNNFKNFKFELHAGDNGYSTSLYCDGLEEF